MKRELSIARGLLQTVDHNTLQIGVGFLVWRLERDPVTAEQLISIAIDHCVQAVWLAFGADLGRWISYIRSRARKTGNAIKIFVQISTVDQALQAVNEWKADVIVIQGW